VGTQIVALSLVGPLFLLRGMNGQPIGANELFVFGFISVFFAFVALGFALRRRNIGSAEVSPIGIRPFLTSGGWKWRFRWADIEAVKVRSGPVGNRWLEVEPGTGPRFVLTAYPTDPVGSLEALEHFAGPGHPLTRAMAMVVGEGA
jgi:hypothetical protein